MRQIVLDTETTGLSTSQGHRIIEIGCLELVNRRITGREYHRFLNPERDIDEGAEAVHGISIDDLAGQPRFADIADEFLEFINGAELVIHNAEFDVGFIEHELQLMEHPARTSATMPWSSTHSISRANYILASAIVSTRSASVTKSMHQNATCTVRSSTRSYSRAFISP